MTPAPTTTVGEEESLAYAIFCAWYPNASDPRGAWDNRHFRDERKRAITAARTALLRQNGDATAGGGVERQALQRLEVACDRRAALLSPEAYNEALKTPGMVEALTELDEARKQARAALRRPSHPAGGEVGKLEARVESVLSALETLWKEYVQVLVRNEALEATAREAEAQARRCGWQTMESAPKDGTWFWAFYPTRCQEDQQQVCRWRERQGWVDAADSMNSDPTHWQPLQPVPASLLEDRTDD